MVDRFSLLILSLLLCFSTAHGTPPNSPFDQYGAIRWEDEKARLDNFAIQLSQLKEYVGYIFVVDSSGGCRGEATARAIRAKRYVTEYRGVPWTQVIWRREGYRDDLSTTLIIAPKTMILGYPFLDTSGTAQVDGPMTRACRATLSRIRKSRW